MLAEFWVPFGGLVVFACVLGLPGLFLISMVNSHGGWDDTIAEARLVATGEAMTATASQVYVERKEYATADNQSRFEYDIIAVAVALPGEPDWTSLSHLGGLNWENPGAAPVPLGWQDPPTSKHHAPMPVHRYVDADGVETVMADADIHFWTTIHKPAFWTWVRRAG